MKVVLSANTSWYLYNFRKNTIKHIIAQGHDVYIVAPIDDYTKQLRSIGCICLNIDISGRGMNPFKELRTLLAFRRVYSQCRPDVIFNFTPKNNVYSTLAAYFSRAKIVNNIAGLGTAFVKPSFSKSIMNFLYKISQRRADLIFFQNKDDQTQFIEKGLAKENNSRLIPGSGVDLNRFMLSLREQDHVTKFILVARLIKEKGIPEFAEAARALKGKYGDRVHFSLAGFVDEGNPSAVAMNDINQWQLNGLIEFLGKTDKVEDLLHNSDCVVLPSYYREGVPKSLLEAAAMGKIIVTTDNVGCREAVINNETGYLCEPRSAASLAAALEKVIMMEQKQRHKMGRAGRDYIARRFDEQIVINEYLSCL